MNVNNSNSKITTTGFTKFHNDAIEKNQLKKSCAKTSISLYKHAGSLHYTLSGYREDTIIFDCSWQGVEVNKCSNVAGEDQRETQ